VGEFGGRDAGGGVLPVISCLLGEYPKFHLGGRFTRAMDSLLMYLIVAGFVIIAFTGSVMLQHESADEGGNVGSRNPVWRC